MDSPQTPAIWIDPATGEKRFATRSAPPGEVRGSGYSVVADAAKLTLPEAGDGATFDADEQERYRAFTDERRGVDDYVPMEGTLGRYLEDHYSAAPVEREVLTDECDVFVVGAGFGGLLLWYKLSRAGFTDVRFCDKGGDVGGTWYWNRYPGIACDVESYSYLPLLEEMEYFPTQRYASGFEIFGYCQQMAERFGFYDHCLFHTGVTAAEWDEDSERWTVRTDRGDEMHARFVVLANGVLTTPRLARIEGMETFAGESFHTSRWDHGVELQGKRIGIIGTGATAVQAIPELAKEAGHLYVFQRTPSTIEVRDQRQTSPEKIEQWRNEPGWALARRARFAEQVAGLQPGSASADREATPGPQGSGEARPTREGKLQRALDAGFRHMERIRARVDAIVEDPETAAALKPYYQYACKRPTFHDEYLPTFNLPHVTLVDVAPQGVQEINERGVVHDGVQYELDVLIHATGFEFMSRDLFARVTGADGRTLAEKWDQQGTRTFAGVHTHTFPNMFLVGGPQGGGAFNFTETIEEHTDHIAALLATMRDRGDAVIDVREEVEVEWAQHCADVDLATAPLRDCLGNFNGYGRAAPGSLLYYGGKGAARRLEWARDTEEPFVFTPGHGGGPSGC